MLKFVKEVAGPSIFTRGLLKYKQGRFEDALKLIFKAGEWMPELETDAFYQAALLLVESKLGAQLDGVRLKNTLESLVDSPYQDTEDYVTVVADLKEIQLGGA